MRKWVLRAGCAPATVARWTTRAAWLADLGQWSRGPEFAAAKARAGVSITAATLLAIAAIMAEYADHDSGRHVAIVRARIAERVGCSVDTVSVAWRLLRLAGWALEVQRGHGGPTTPAGGRRPSVYHLIPQRTLQPSPAQNTEGVENPDLPPKAGSCSSSPVGTSSPSARTRRKSATSTGSGRRWRAAPRPDRPPRPLPLQRLAGQLTARCHGLHRGHIGAIADVLTTAGIDPAVWSARAITDALDADMRAGGWSWPDRIAHPTVIPPAELAAIAGWCDANGVRLISDEVYHGLVYPGAPQTACAWQTSRNAVVVNSFSKYYAMTGWRLGWLLVPEELRRAVDCLTGNFTICPPVLPQHAAVAAFTPEAVAEADGHLRHYSANRDTLIAGLRQLGLTRLAPADGAFYVYADVSDFTGDSLRWCETLLADTGLAIAPGIDFDTMKGGSSVRLSFAGPTQDIDGALRRLGPWLSR